MYRKHWNLTRKPFVTAFESELIYFRESFAEAFHMLSLSAHMAPVNLIITGDKGSGKSTLLRKIEEALVDEVSFSLLSGRYLSSRLHLLEMLDAGNEFTHLASQLNIEQRLNTFYQASNRNNSVMVIAVDDADLIDNSDVIDEVRKLQHYGQDRKWPLVTIVAGKTVASAFRPKGKHEAREIYLPLPSRNECGELIDHRLAVCGAKKSIFTPSAMESIISKSKGDISQLLTFADLCLQVGYVAKVEVIDDDVVRNRVEPFVQRFFHKEPQLTETIESHGLPGSLKNVREEILKARETINGKTQEEDAATTETDSDDSQGDSEGAKGAQASPWSTGPQRLVSQAELETYRISSLDSDQPEESEKLKKPITPAKPEKTVEDKKPDEDKNKRVVKARPQTEEKKVATEESRILDESPNLDYQTIYKVGAITVKSILDKLRKKQQTDLSPISNLSNAIVTALDEDMSLLQIVLEDHNSYDMQYHLMNVAILSVVCGKEMQLNIKSRLELGEIALIHDIGHLHCGEDLLLSENRFDRQDFKAIKQHPMVGKDLILNYTNGTKLMADVIAQEHERDDGLGYPNYLAGNQIHLYAKVIAICDVFEALSHSRAHRRALTPEESIVQISATMARRTEPRIIRALRNSILKTLSR